MHNVNRIEFTYDGFGRVTGRTYSNTSGATRRVTTYTYQDVGTDKTTTLLKSVNNSGFGELGYEYDAVGNITQITKNGTVQETYTYDALNQLKTVTHNGITTEYNYQNGNITSVTQNGTVIKTYGYTNSSWSDLLTSFNGQTITYDEIGNPLQYRDGMSFTWAKGRQLQSVTKDGLTASYTYDENGLRLSKTVNGVTTNIFRTNGQMVGMNSSDGKDMTFMLDGNGNVYGVHYDHYSSNQPKSETYYFAFNAQGDVIGIYEFSGRLMATYDYDEWGNCTVNVLAADNNGHAVDSPDHIAYANPFRYRGYFYNAETGFYYLNSRYYDPGTGRFVNADGFVQTGQGILDKNMFAYCGNNPVNRTDSNGNSWSDIKKWFCDKWNAVKSWANNTFGVSGEEVFQITEQETFIPDVLPITQKTGVTEKSVNQRTGQSSKSVTASYSHVINDPMRSTASVKIQLNSFDLKLTVGLTDISIMGSHTSDNVTNSLGYILNLSELKIGAEHRITQQWDTDHSTTVYTNASLNGWSIMALYMFYYTGTYNSPEACYGYGQGVPCPA